ncbi:MAG: endonuclease/exonuclease/phosphatase family protein [Anaerolineae bacterium]
MDGVKAGEALRKMAVATAHVYLVGVMMWAGLRQIFLDRWWWLFVLNTFAIYLFAPLPLAFFVAGWARRREIWIGSVLVLLVGMGILGPFYLPHTRNVEAGGPRLTVMTTNVLGYNTNPGPIVEAIREADADLVAIQELNAPTAETIHRELADAYPYRIFDPRPGVSGMGLLSRYPLTPTGETLPGQWIGTPQVLELDFEGVLVTVVHAHPFPTQPVKPHLMQRSIEARTEQARILADFVAAHPGPLLAPGDFNTTAHTRAYALLTENLVDAWREAAWGPGHTWPGSLPLRWLVRIDYVFHSPEWRAVEAEIGPWDGASDHRPVVATLVLLAEAGLEE